MCKGSIKQRGVAVVEFALILPLLLLLLIGSIDVSLALYNKSVITNASREGARAGIVARNPVITDAEIFQIVEEVVENHTKSALVNLGASKRPRVTIEKGKLGVSSSPTLKVSVFFEFDGLGLGSLSKALGKSWDVSASTVMVYE
jgi:Flp pilus assembly protein TadG